MRDVAVVTDGSSDLPKEMAEKYDIYVVPFKVIIGTKSYKFYGNYGTITTEEFYQLIEETGELPQTSLPSPYDFMQTFEEAAKKAKTVIAVLLSKKLSATFHTAKIALEQLENIDITLVDSQVAASTLGLLVIEAAKMAKKGFTKNEILHRLTQLIPHGRLAGFMNDLEASYRSGRINWARHFLAKRLRIKPLVIFKDGEIISDGIIRGGKRKIKRRMRYCAPIVVENSIVDNIFVWHVQAEEEAKELKTLMEKNNPEKKKILVQEAGPVIGTHVGKNAVAYMYIGKYNRKWFLKMKKKKRSKG